MYNCIAVLLIIVAVLFHPVRLVRAADFMDVEISGAARAYVVLKDLNVRTRPDTKSKRIGGLKKGQIIQSPGGLENWAAVLSGEGEALGFAYKKFLLSVLNGRIDEPVNGNARIADSGRCRYAITFDGKSHASDNTFKMADYEVDLKCVYKGRRLQLTLFMFMTESPMAHAKPSKHQISVDLLQIEMENALGEVFSTNIIYDRENNTIAFDGVTVAEYGDNPPEPERPAESIPEALDGAVRMALESWNHKTWEALADHMP